MPTGWEDFDKQHSRLWAIKNRFRDMKKLAGEAQDHLNSLRDRPSFETPMAAELNSLESELALMLAFVRGCQSYYQSLLVNDHHVH